jgi:hypothetical protein
MDNCVLKADWHTFKVVTLEKFLTDDNTGGSNPSHHGKVAFWRPYIWIKFNITVQGQLRYERIMPLFSMP